MGSDAVINRKLPFLFIFMLSGCAGFVPLQPNPDEYERWSASGASQVDVMKAMLECGYTTPFRIADRELNIYPSSNEVALIVRCMEGSGFLYDGSSLNYCKDKGFRELPACQLDAPVRRRELSRRVNSPFCKKYTKADACKP
ncbi:hypothetical protein [Xanthomonas oryzae]|nr:hypothetical protein [Xanthomonas oryzae]UXV80328.1 hypothetical protein IXO842_020600 [Xanthomonas oryzae pv. oryzae]UXW31802.1 hypothetical protein IXO644_002705 [Xanthomonas oryzae pv. oryzae]UZF09565.1 hypothetical protein IXO645_002700 [Xanthomonas oryzae pv. oryzae]